MSLQDRERRSPHFVAAVGSGADEAGMHHAVLTMQCGAQFIVESGYPEVIAEVEEITRVGSMVTVDNIEQAAAKVYKDPEKIRVAYTGSRQTTYPLVGHLAEHLEAEGLSYADGIPARYLFTEQIYVVPFVEFLKMIVISPDDNSSQKGVALTFLDKQRLYSGEPYLIGFIYTLILSFGNDDIASENNDFARWLLAEIDSAREDGFADFITVEIPKTLEKVWNGCVTILMHHLMKILDREFAEEEAAEDTSVLRFTAPLS